MEIWSQVIIALITGALAGGGVAGIIKARANSAKTLGQAWSTYAGSLEREVKELKKEVQEIPALKASIDAMGAEISALQSENINLKAQHAVLLAWNEDLKVWSGLLSSQVLELGGSPTPFERRKKNV